MKSALLVTTAIFALTSCDNSNKPPKPTTGSNNVTESSAIGACPTDKSGGEEEKFAHVDQIQDILAKIKAGKNQEVFNDAFEKGDIMFATAFTKEQGSGANVGGNLISQYTSMPRADLTESGQWATHIPKRATGPNAQACVECHIEPVEDGAGTTALNVHRDPEHTGDPKQIIQRNTPHLFGMGALQLLAEEMTGDLHAIVKKAGAESCVTGKEAKSKLMAKGVYFGTVTMTCSSGVTTVDDSQSILAGIDPDFVVRPFEWKKSVTFVRDFVRGASHNEIGMQGLEIVGKNVDGDGDGVKDELSIGDMTAFTVYMAAQPRPTSKLELEKWGLIKKMSAKEHQQIAHGEQLFGNKGIDCASCHLPQLTLKNTLFSEPSQSEFYRDKRKNNGGNLPVDLVDEGVDPAHAITFDLTKDQPDNVFCQNGKKIHLGSLEKEHGAAVVRLYGDLKQHYMGDELAESIHEVGTGHMGMVPYDPVNAIVNYQKTEEEGKASFGTKELWGVACTGPWLHDGRATTLKEAIMLHGGEAASSRDAFAKLDEASQKDLIAFLGNLVLYNKKAGDSTIPSLASACTLNELEE